MNNGDDRILLVDERGGLVASTVPIERLNPGGGVIGPDGRYCVGSRSLRTILAFPASLSGPAVPLVPVDVVAFPRGFAFSSDGHLFLAEGASGAGAGAIFAMSAALGHPKVRLVEDKDLSPLDLAVAPNGNIVTSSEVPFGAEDAVTSVREYDPRTGSWSAFFDQTGRCTFDDLGVFASVRTVASSA